MRPASNNKLDFSEEQLILLDSSREFCREKSTIKDVRNQLESVSGFDQKVWEEMISLGWLGITVPEDLDGSGLGIRGLVPVVENMGRAMLGTPLISSTLASQLIVRSGVDDYTSSLLARIIGGAPATIALLENADWGDIRVSCEIGSDLTLRGVKDFVDDAMVAQIFILPAIRDGSLALAIIERDQLPDDAVVPHVLIDQTKRSGRVDLNGVKVDAKQIIQNAKIEKNLKDIRLLGALLAAAEQTGTSAACLDAIVGYLNTRKQFGKLIGSYQALKHPAVEILTMLDSSRSFIYHAATVVTDDLLCQQAEVACHMAKAQSTDTLVFAGDRAVQFHGGMGFTFECDAQLYIRRAQWSQQYYGDSAYHRSALAHLLLDDVG